MNGRVEFESGEATAVAVAARGGDVTVLSRALRPSDAARPFPKRPAGGRDISVFVHLARDKDADAWRAARLAGRLVGINDDTPYGYGRAEAMGCNVAFSRSKEEGRLGRLMRLGVRAVLGFDLVHAWQNRAAIAAADVVWTHTESQYLAVAAVLGRGNRPKIIGQTVWLMDRWERLGPLYRALYRRLMRRIDVLTFHSEDNLAVARAALPGADMRLVRYGIASEEMTPPVRRDGRPVRVLAIGNDRDRDWKTLVAAVEGEADVSLTILSGTVPRRLKQAANVTVRRASSNEELMAAFADATLVCVPLKLNCHASGITVIQEAVLAGVPVVASNAGGLPGYFPADEVRYVPPGDAAALRQAILETAADPDAALARSVKAQARMAGGELGAEAYIRHHVHLTRELLAR